MDLPKKDYKAPPHSTIRKLPGCKILRAVLRTPGGPFSSNSSQLEDCLLTGCRFSSCGHLQSPESSRCCARTYPERSPSPEARPACQAKLPQLHTHTHTNTRETDSDSAILYNPTTYTSYHIPFVPPGRMGTTFSSDVLLSCAPFQRCFQSSCSISPHRATARVFRKLAPPP